MPDMLLELFSEEIPARMQARAAADLKKLVTDGLVEAGLTYASAGVFSTPRRLVLTVEGLLGESKPVREERKGPKADAPDAALQGFLRSTGLTRDQLQLRDDKKGPGVFRRDRKAGACRPRDYRRSGRSGYPQLPLAKVDALGQGVFALGAALAFDPVHPVG